MALTARVSRVLSSSTTSESTKSSSCQAVFSFLMIGLGNLYGDHHAVKSGQKRGFDAIERRRGPDLQRALIVAHNVQFHGGFDHALVNAGADSGVAVIDLAGEGDHLLYDLLKRQKGFVNARHSSSVSLLTRQAPAAQGLEVRGACPIDVDAVVVSTPCSQRFWETRICWPMVSADLPQNDVVERHAVFLHPRHGYRVCGIDGAI